MIDGMHDLLALRGGSIASVLPTVLSLMDGNHTLEEIEAACPEFSSTSLGQIVSRLAEYGLIEEGNVTADNADVFPDNVVGFFRRFGASSGAGSARDCCASLRRAAVTIVAPKTPVEYRFANRVQEMLRHSGTGSVNIIEAAELQGYHPVSPGQPRIFIVSLCFDKDETIITPVIDAWCRTRGIEWLRVLVDLTNHRVELGPLFDGVGVCHQCFRDMYSPDTAPNAVSKAPAESDGAFWAGMIATELIYVIVDMFPATGRSRFRRCNLTTLAQTDLYCVRMPGCARCNPLVEGEIGSQPTPINSAVAFEDVMESFQTSVLNPRHRFDPKHSPQDRSIKQLSHLKRHTVSPLKRLQSGPTTALHALTDPSPSHLPLTLERLSTLLQVAAGPRGLLEEGHVQRWAATAGNLGSVELYIAIRVLEGFSAGLYYFDAANSSFVSIGPPQQFSQVEDFMCRLVAQEKPDLPDCLVLFTGAFHRLSHKYDVFAYRLLHFDAGVAVAQFCAVANALGVRAHPLMIWADDVMEQYLRLSPFQEQPTAAVAVYRDRQHTPNGYGKVFTAADFQRTIGHSSSQGRDLVGGYWDILRTLYQESRITETILSQFTNGNPDHGAHDVCRSWSGAAFGSTLQDVMRLDEALSARRSVRRFDNLPIASEQLRTVLQAATADAGIDRLLNEGDLTLMILCRSVHGLTAAIYHYDATLQRLVDSGHPAIEGPQLRETLDQGGADSASAQIWILANVTAVSNKFGPWGHRYLMVEAGRLANRLWIGGLGLGLSGAVLAGISRAAARKHLGIDGYSRSPMLAVTLGHVWAGRQETEMNFRNQVRDAEELSDSSEINAKPS